MKTNGPKKDGGARSPRGGGGLTSCFPCCLPHLKAIQSLPLCCVAAYSNGSNGLKCDNSAVSPLPTLTGTLAKLLQNFHTPASQNIQATFICFLIEKAPLLHKSVHKRRQWRRLNPKVVKHTRALFMKEAARTGSNEEGKPEQRERN